MSQDMLITLGGISSDTLLEVALSEQPEGGPTIALRRLSWGEGVGWYRQQTLRLDALEAEGLLQILARAKRKRSGGLGQPRGKVIAFPLGGDQQRETRRQTA